MKYIKTFETQQTPSEILNLFTDRIRSVILDDYKLQVERTKGSYKLVIVDNNKVIGRLYIQDIKKKGDKFYAEIRRVHVNDEYRNKGLGSKLLQKVIEIFGDFNLYLYPSPNRIKDLTSDNKESYRNRLINFYGNFGFKKNSNSNRMERYNESTRFDVEEFIMYVLDFYDEKGQEYFYFIGKKELNRKIIKDYAYEFVSKRKKQGVWGGDSYDREIFRDLLRFKFGLERIDKLEYDIRPYVADFEIDADKYNL